MVQFSQKLNFEAGLLQYLINNKFSTENLNFSSIRLISELKIVNSHYYYFFDNLELLEHCAEQQQQQMLQCVI